MSLWDRLQGIWSGDAHSELLSVLDDWRIDYAFDDEFQHVVELLEGHILDEEYRDMRSIGMPRNFLMNTTLSTWQRMKRSTLSVCYVRQVCIDKCWQVRHTTQFNA
jgi:uncharacterized protein YpbB